MITIDYITIGVGLFAIVSGLIMGFGKVLKFITDGFLGKIFSLIICYFLYGIVLKMPFIQDLLLRLVTVLSQKENLICNLLITIRIDLIALAVALFIVVLLINKLVVGLIKKIFETDNKVMRVINKTLGLILMCAFIAVLALVVLQILFLIQGVDGGVFAFLNGSKLGIDKLYVSNPLNSIVESFKQTTQTV